jgi:hypothetical protein
LQRGDSQIGHGARLPVTGWLEKRDHAPLPVEHGIGAIFRAGSLPTLLRACLRHKLLHRNVDIIAI